MGAERSLRPGEYGTPGYDIIALIIRQRYQRHYPWFYPGEEPALWSGLDGAYLLWGWNLEETKRIWCKTSASLTVQEIWGATTDAALRKDWSERFGDAPFPGDAEGLNPAGSGEPPGNAGESAAGGMEVR